MVVVLTLHVDSSEIKEELCRISFAFVEDEISKAEVHAPPLPLPRTHITRAHARTLPPTPLPSQPDPPPISNSHTHPMPTAPSCYPSIFELPGAMLADAR